MSDTPELWKLSLTVPLGAIEDVEGRLTEAAGERMLSISSFERPGHPEGDSLRVVEALFDGDPGRALIEGALKGVATGGLELGPLETRDWVAESQASLPPIRAGRFFVHGGHDAGKVPVGAIALHIEAAQAFGTGHHGTTLGCLLAFDGILKRGMGPKHILDVGCGTGVLAIAAAKALRCPVIASDIDPLAVDITLENARLNGVASQVTTVTATGLDHAALRKGAPYDLIFANILAKPLIELAPAMAQLLRPGGLVILSGLLNRQMGAVTAAYRAAGLQTQRRRSREGWATLVMQKR